MHKLKRFERLRALSLLKMNTAGKLLLVLLFLKLSSCVNTRQIQYLQGQFDTARLSQYVIKEPRIQVGDLLSIVVYSDNPEATALYNLPNVTGTTTLGATASTSGYLVDDSGRINFQGIGTLQVAELTKSELTGLLNAKLSPFLKNPYYNIRFLNYKITLLGEVSREGSYTFSTEKVNIFDAIGLAGGLTIYARRENVMLIREANGKREFARLDLTDPEVLNSPYYFLQQNDLVIVDPSKAKSTANEQVTIRNISLISSIISTLAIVYSIVVVNR
jgi:polysaccharide export outer membrane protein